MRVNDLSRTAACALAVLLATCKIDKLTNHPPPIPGLSVAPGRVRDSAAVGSTAMLVDSIALSSSGAGALSWSASVKSGGGWLDVTPRTGTTPAHVAGCYRGLIDTLVVDEADADAVADLGVRPVVTRTLMRDEDARRRLMESVLEAAGTVA